MERVVAGLLWAVGRARRASVGLHKVVAALPDELGAHRGLQPWRRKMANPRHIWVVAVLLNVRAPRVENARAARVDAPCEQAAVPASDRKMKWPVWGFFAPPKAEGEHEPFSEKIFQRIAISKR